MSKVLYSNQISVKAYTRGTNNAYTFYQTVILNSQSIENNTSNITVIYSAKGNNFNYYLFKTPKASINIYDNRSGTTRQVAYETIAEINPKNTEVTLISYTEDIKHNDDGTLAISVDTSYNPYTSNYEYLPEANTISSGTLYLDTIQRASEPSTSLQSLVIGETSVRIKTNRQGDFKHTLKCDLGGYVETIASNITDYYDWIPNIEILNHMPVMENGKKECNIICETYYNGIHIGTKYTPIVLELPSNAKPVITKVELIEEGEELLDKNWENTYVKNMSIIKIKITTNSYYQSPVRYEITGLDDKEYNTDSNEITSGYLQNDGEKTIKIKAIDQRGHYDTKEVKYECFKYSNPEIKVKASRSDSSGKDTDDGTFLKYSFISSVSPLREYNVGKFEIGYKLASASTYKYEIISEGVKSIEKNDNVLLTDYVFNSLNRYDIAFKTTDIFGNSSIVYETLGTVPDLLNFNASGKSLAIGKISEASESEKKLEIAMDTEITGKLKIIGEKNGKIFEFIEEK